MIAQAKIAEAGAQSEKTCRSARLWRTKHYDIAVASETSEAIYDCTGENW